MRPLDLTSLRAVDSLAKTLNFRETAALLNMTQPALSVRIKRLEDQLGLKLFDRSRTGVALSEAGIFFLPYVRNVLRELDASEHAIRRIKDGTEGRLRLGYTPVSFQNCLPQGIHSFTTRHPGVEVFLEEMLSDEVEKALEAGRIDVGVLHPPTSINCNLTQLPGDRYVVAVHQNDFLASKSSIQLSDIKDRDIVVTRRAIGPSIYSQIERVCRSAGFEPRIVQEASNSISVLALVAAGLGVGLVAGSLQRLGQAEVRLVQIDGEAPELPTALATAARETRSPLVGRLVAELRSSFENPNS